MLPEKTNYPGKMGRGGGVHTALLVPQTGLFLFVCQGERAFWRRAL